jgi:hypothetical protein
MGVASQCQQALYELVAYQLCNTPRLNLMLSSMSENLQSEDAVL